MPTLAKPVMGGISSHYGWRYVNGVRNFHNGLDFYWLNANIAESRKVYSAAPGVVVDAGYGSEPGNYVLVDIGGGYKVRYIHLASDNVTVGQRVGYSTRIGTMGDTGTATRPGQIHLHMDLYSGSSRINPEPYMTLPFGYTGSSLAGGGTTPIEDIQEEDMAHFDLIQTPDGTVWWCVDRVLRYAIPTPANLATYQAFHKSLQGTYIAITQKSATDINAYGAPVFADWLQRIPAPSGSGGAPTAAENAAAVEAALADNFARVPTDVNNDLKNRL